jgi:hypothetical protein
MRIKIAAYTIAAILMGFVVMMLPLALKTGPPTYQPRIPGEYQWAPNTAGAERDSMQKLYGLTSSPSIIMPSSLILLTGLATGLIAYIFFKKQTMRQ